MTAPGAVICALLAAYGVFLLYTALALRWRGIAPGPGQVVTRRRRTAAGWLERAGLTDVRPLEVAAVGGVLFVVGVGIGFAVFGGLLAPFAVGLVAAALPVSAARARRGQRTAAAREAWPRMIEELRLLAMSAGRSVPQALFEVGRRGPVELRPAFAAAQREWLVSTDFERAIRVLKAHLSDATADAVGETLLIAHEMGGTDIDRRLSALVEDRMLDLHGRKDAAAKQAGARFARMFVLLVPAGMALVGLSIGDGRAAYATSAGQLAVVTAMTMMAGCWWWAGRLLRLPAEERVFSEPRLAGRGGRRT